jgi:hypothetical protein
MVVLEMETEQPKQMLKGVSSKLNMKAKKKLSTSIRGKNKKTLLAMAALTCRKLTSWTGLVVDKETRARQEAPS